jgi:non-homologous end joining protein Ku
MIAVEPRGTGMALFTLRAAEEVRAAQFGVAEGELGAQMVAIAKAIIAQRTGSLAKAAIHIAGHHPDPAPITRSASTAIGPSG